MSAATYTLRAALAGDAAAIASVHIASWRTTYAELLPAGVIAARTAWSLRYPLWVERLNGGRTAFVAEDSGGIAGFACASAMSAHPQGREPLPYDAYLESLYLLKRAQGHGVGRALLGAIAAPLVAAGYASMALHVLSTNPARGFYERLGALFVRDEPPEPDTGTHTCAYAFPDVAALTISRG